MHFWKYSWQFLKFYTQHSLKTNWDDFSCKTFSNWKLTLPVLHIKVCLQGHHCIVKKVVWSLLWPCKRPVYSQIKYFEWHQFSQCQVEISKQMWASKSTVLQARVRFEATLAATSITQPPNYGDALWVRKVLSQKMRYADTLCHSF